MMTQRQIKLKLLKVKKKNKWSWERMCRELHAVMGTEGPSHTTLFRYATGAISRPNVVVQKWVEQGLEKL